MVQIEITYEGSLRTRAVHGPSGVELVTDAPLDNGGKAESFSPTDLCATALGACMLTIMGQVAARHGWDLTGTRVSVKKHMVKEPVRRIGKLEVVIRVPRDFDERARTSLERAALTCPVHQSLDHAIEIPLRFEWGAATSV
ncbi:MAG: OsmC family protein [Planctomycetes bacterium]|nr:OsmC family protein [Planctomycetota bacterium]